MLQDEARCGCFRRSSGVAYIALKDGFVTQVDFLTFRTQTRLGKRDDVINAIECRWAVAAEMCEVNCLLCLLLIAANRQHRRLAYGLVSLPVTFLCGKLMQVRVLVVPAAAITCYQAKSAGNSPHTLAESLRCTCMWTAAGACSVLQGSSSELYNICSCWSSGNDWSIKLWSDALALKVTLQVQAAHYASYVT